MFYYPDVWRRQWHPTPVLLLGKSHGRRGLVGCSPWGRSESDTTEQLHVHFSLSCIGEGNGNPLQCSCLENPRDGWAWRAVVYGVAQSRTRLKRLSSSSCSIQVLSISAEPGSNMWKNLLTWKTVRSLSCQKDRSQSKFIDRSNEEDTGIPLERNILNNLS